MFKHSPVNSLLTFIALNTAVVYLVDQLLDGFLIQEGALAYVLVGVIFGVLNLFLKPILKVLSLPFIFLTAGLFVLVVNAVILYTTEYLVGVLEISRVSLTIDGTGTYIAAVLTMGILNYVFQKLLR